MSATIVDEQQWWSDEEEDVVNAFDADEEVVEEDVQAFDADDDEDDEEEEEEVDIHLRAVIKFPPVYILKALQMLRKSCDSRQILTATTVHGIFVFLNAWLDSTARPEQKERVFRTLAWLSQTTLKNDIGKPYFAADVVDTVVRRLCPHDLCLRSAVNLAGYLFVAHLTGLVMAAGTPDSVKSTALSLLVVLVTENDGDLDTPTFPLAALNECTLDDDRVQTLCALGSPLPSPTSSGLSQSVAWVVGLAVVSTRSRCTSK